MPTGKRKIDPVFFRQLVIAAGVLVVLSAWPLYIRGTKEIIIAASTGLILTVLNVVAGYAAIEYSYEGSYTRFIQVVLGGMGIRMLLLLSILGVLIGVFRFHVLALVGSMFGSYMVFLVLEVLFIQRKMEEKNRVK